MNCTDRFVGCHSKCDRYKTFKVDVTARNDLIRAKKHISVELERHKIKTINSNAKRVNKSPKRYSY